MSKVSLKVLSKMSLLRSTECVITVSYTHLDVYKRQERERERERERTGRQTDRLQNRIFLLYGRVPYMPFVMASLQENGRLRLVSE